MMRAVIQRVKKAELSVEGSAFSAMRRGMLILLGIEEGDVEADLEYMYRKSVNLRIFPDENGIMNLSALETNAEIMIVSQFTLLGDCRKGRRPSYNAAMTPINAKSVYEKVIVRFQESGLTIQTGSFGAMMDISLINWGPVTLLLDSRKLI